MGCFFVICELFGYLYVIGGYFVGILFVCFVYFYCWVGGMFIDYCVFSWFKFINK